MQELFPSQQPAVAQLQPLRQPFSGGQRVVYSEQFARRQAVFPVAEAEPERMFEEFCSVFKAKLWCLEMVNFIEVLEDIGCFGFWDVCLLVHVNLERILN